MPAGIPLASIIAERCYHLLSIAAECALELVEDAVVFVEITEF